MMKCFTSDHTDLTKYIFKRNRGVSKYAFELVHTSTTSDRPTDTDPNFGMLHSAFPRRVTL